MSSSIPQNLRDFMSRVFFVMSMGLLVTAGTSMFILSVPSVFYKIFSSPLRYLFMFAPFGIAMYMQFRLMETKASTIQNLFWIYCILTGVTMSGVFLIYTGESIARTFFIASALFLSASLYGKTAKKDLTYMGMFMVMGIIGMVIASVVNYFMHSTALEFAISFIGVIVFTGITAYDVQRFSNLYYQLEGSGETVTKIAIIGALSLYINFLNLFISLLRFFGNKRSN